MHSAFIHAPHSYRALRHAPLAGAGVHGSDPVDSGTGLSLGEPAHDDARSTHRLRRTQQSARTFRSGRLNYPGSDLLSHAVTSAVPSALEGLTSVFGMGTGVAPPASPPGIGWQLAYVDSRVQPSDEQLYECNVVKPHGRLVPLS